MKTSAMTMLLTEQSTSIAALAEALATVQGELASVRKDQQANVGTYSYRYADLASCWEACRVLLSQAGLAVVQTLELHPGYAAVVATTLVHRSGEWIRGRCGLPIRQWVDKAGEVRVEAPRPQELGSLTTYLRRYGLCAVVGLATEDDDAQTAMAMPLSQPRQDETHESPSTGRGKPRAQTPQKTWGRFLEDAIDHAQNIGVDLNGHQLVQHLWKTVVFPGQTPEGRGHKTVWREVAREWPRRWQALRQEAGRYIRYLAAESVRTSEGGNDDDHEEAMAN